MTDTLMFATVGDRDAVIAIWDKCGLTRPWNDPSEDFRLAIEGSTSAILVLRQGNRISATIMVGFDGHRGWVYYLGVDPQCRRKGFGRMMMDAAERWLREQNAPKIQLMIRNDNEQAITFYEALGYEVQPVMTVGRRLERSKNLEGRK